jgi:uncharacterized RDD family membrane protein YckC
MEALQVHPVQYEGVQYEDTITIETPEGVDLSVTLAGLGSRFVAGVIDALIQTGMIFIFFLALGIAGGAASASGVDGGGALAVALSVVLVFLTVFGYPVLFETLNSGRTPGKAAIGIRVVREGGRPVNFGAAAIRNLVRLVDVLPVSYAIGMISILVSKKNQRLGDMAAGTLVVRDRKPEPSGPQWIQATAPVAPGEVDSWDVSSIGDEEIATVRSFLARRFQLTPEARVHLGNELATRLRTKVAGADPYLPSELFLEKLSAAKSRRS